MTSRGALVAAALVVQSVVLVSGWLVAFRIVQRSFAHVIERRVIDENRRLAETVAELFPEEMTAGAGENVAYKSETWERLQRVIETDALRQLPEGGFACLVEPDGRVLCHPDIRDNESIRSFSFAGKRIRASVAGSGGDRVTEAGSVETFASGVVDFALGDSHFVATAPLGTSGLRLLVHQPIDALVMAGRRSTGSVILIAVGVLVTVVGATGAGLATLLRRYDSVHERLNRQLKENLRTAQRIQVSTLPRAWPSVPGYGIAAWSQPAEETGGDTFDVVGLIEDGHGHRLVERGEAGAVALALADATGHGVGPAIAVTQLQAMARVAWRTTRHVESVAMLLSERLAESLPEGRFITAWLAKLDPARHELETFSAGQGPIFVVRASGEVDALGADSFPLGIAPELLTGPRSVALGVGDAVVVVSDGLIEATDAEGAQFGVVRMAELLRSRRSGSAEEIAAAVRSTIAAFEVGGPRDDQTMLVVKREAV